MKKVLMLLTFCGLVFVSNAQIQKGNIMVGSNLSSLRLGLEKNSGIDFAISPKAAWFIQDGLAIGGMVNFGLSHKGEGTGSALTYFVGPMGRYYVNDKNIEVLKKGKFFLEGNVGISGANQTKTKTSTNGLGFGFGPGYSYFVTPNIGLEALLRYDGKVGFGSETYASNLYLGVGFQIYIPCPKTK